MGEFHLRTFTVTITRRNPSSSWGVSIAGGCDQGTPLVITKVSLVSMCVSRGTHTPDIQTSFVNTVSLQSTESLILLYNWMSERRKPNIPKSSEKMCVHV